VIFFILIEIITKEIKGWSRKILLETIDSFVVNSNSYESPPCMKLFVKNMHEKILDLLMWDIKSKFVVQNILFSWKIAGNFDNLKKKYVIKKEQEN